MKKSRYGQAARDMAVGFAVFLGVAWGQPWRLLAQGPAPATGVRYAQVNENETLERDNKGPRTGFASKAEVLAK